MKYIITSLYILMLFTATEGFGLRTNDWGAIGTGNWGLFSICQLLLIVLIFVSIFYPKGDYKIQKSRIGFWYGVYLSLFAVICFELFFQAASNFDVELSSILNIFELRYALFFFVTVIVCRICGTDQTFKYLFWSAIVSSIIALGVVLFNVPSDTSIKIVMSEGSIVHAYRVLMPTATLISLGYFYSLMSFRQEKNIIYLLAAFICFAALLVQLHRSSTFSLLLVTVLFLWHEYKIRASSIIPTIVTIIVLFISANLLFNVIGYSFETLWKVAETTNEGMLEGTDNTATMRFDMLGKALEYNVNNYGIFGIGLSWEKLDMDDYLFTHLTLRPTNDSGYYNIIIMFGVLGSLIFILLIARVFWSLISLRRNSDKSSITYKHASICMWTLLNVLFVSLGSDNFVIYAAGASIFFSLIALSHVTVIDNLNEDIYSED